MDDTQHTGAPYQGPHYPADHAEPLPTDFSPLRLILQPNGASFELVRPDMIAGRHSEADIRLPMPDVSRRHCRFVFGNGNWVVMDLNSLNGVYVNDEPVGQRTLRQGDRLRIGGYVFGIDLSRETIMLPKSDTDTGLAQNIFPTLRLPSPQRRAS